MYVRWHIIQRKIKDTVKVYKLLRWLRSYYDTNYYEIEYNMDGSVIGRGDLNHFSCINDIENRQLWNKLISK